MRVLSGLELSAEARAGQGEVLDVGCGNALFFPKLKRFGNVRGIEVDADLLDPEHPDRHRIHTKLLGDPEYAGPNWRFDLITALDVIEHIQDDGAAIEHMLAMLKPGGYLVLTVPAFMSLWDAHDEINHHFRRYTRKQLAGLVQSPGRVCDVRYLFHSLYPPKWIVAQLNRTRAMSTSQTAMPMRPVNAMMTAANDVEHRLLSWLRLPWGTSLLAVIHLPA